jgi:hypothetical protein
MAEMKQDGVEYQERMDELEKLEYPKPNREFIYSTFNAFSDKHPWVGQENIRPKSIVREMFEQYRSFADYIKDYELQRAEGLLLRHINSVHKVLSQTVPDRAKTEAVLEMEIYLKTMIRQVDSSLLDEWEKLKNPNYLAAESKPDLKPPGAEEAARDVTRDTRTFHAAVRTRIFTFLRALQVGELENALAEFEPENSVQNQAEKISTLKTSWETYLQSHQRFSLDPNARNQRHSYFIPSEDKKTLTVEQVLVDPEEFNDWVAVFQVDLQRSREAAEPVMIYSALRAIGR